MENSELPIQRPLDCFVEWFVKGVNIGAYYSLFFARREVNFTGLSRVATAAAFTSYALKQCVVFGGVLGTWQFITHATANARHVEDPLNYSVAAALTLLLWHIPLQIPAGKLPLTCVGMAAAGYFLGRLNLSALS